MPFQLECAQCIEQQLYYRDGVSGQSAGYPKFTLTAVDQLSMLPSSTHVERILSTGGEATTGKRNRLTNHNLEREILLRQNKKYLYLV